MVMMVKTKAMANAADQMPSLKPTIVVKEATKAAWELGMPP